MTTSRTSDSPTAASLGLVVRRVDVEAIVDLRHSELRQGRPRETAYFAGDGAPETRHYAALHGADVVGCATFTRAPLREQWADAPALQLRGMATRSDLVGRGIGRLLLAAATADVRTAGEIRLWCNARTSAVGFYEAMGWRVVSEPFEVEGIGPHVKMIATTHGLERPAPESSESGPSPAERSSQVPS